MIIKHIDSDEIARARMNLIQWTALATRMNRAVSLKQLSDLPRFKIIKKSSISEVAKLKKFLCNGWTTESLLKQNAASFEGEALNHSLVWAFPQAYYSVYAVTLAYFDASGFTNNKTHSNIIKNLETNSVTAITQKASLSMQAVELIAKESSRIVKKQRSHPLSTKIIPTQSSLIAILQACSIQLVSMT